MVNRNVRGGIVQGVTVHFSRIWCPYRFEILGIRHCCVRAALQCVRHIYEPIIYVAPIDNTQSRHVTITI